MAFKRNRLRAICFDVDGTLRDTDDQFVTRLARLIGPLASFTHARQPKDLARKIVMAIENPGNLLITLGDRLGIDGMLNRIGDWTYHPGPVGSPDSAPMIEGTYEMLKRLQIEFSLAIVSSRGQKVTMDFLNRHGLLPFFKFVATSQTCQHTKP